MGLFRNAAFNFSGAMVPAVAALLTVPVLIRALGPTHYGVFVLVTSIVGYFAILDINATAGSVKYIAQYRAVGAMDKVRRVLSFGFALYAFIGLVGGLLIFFFAELLATRLFNIPIESRTEAIQAMRWAGAAFFCGQIQAYLQSVPQALQRYDLTGRLEAFFGTAVAVASMAVAWLGAGLVGVVVVRLMLSVLNIGVLVWVVRQALPSAAWLKPDRETVRSVASFSAFSYLARLASLSAAHTDKLIIGALIDMNALAWFSVPALLVNRVYALAFRLAQVIFPRVSALAAKGQQEHLQHNYLDASRYVVGVNASLLLLLVTFAPELMHYWAGPGFGDVAVQVMLILAFALFMDTLTNVPSLVNDGLGHPQVTGVAAVSRALLSILAAFIGVRFYGILGAAIAQFFVSSVANLAFLIFVHGLTVPIRLEQVWAKSWLPSLPIVVAASIAGAWALQRTVMTPTTAFGLLLLLVLALAGFGWFCVVLPAHRLRLRAVIAGRGLV